MGWLLAVAAAGAVGSGIVLGLRRAGASDLAGGYTPAPPAPTTSGGSPTGTPPDVMQKLAVAVVSSLLSDGARYDRSAVRAFQQAAGLRATGMLDGTTAMALAQYGSDALVQVAKKVSEDVRANPSGYDAGMVSVFQALAHLQVTGIYDTATANRMASYFPDAPPPAVQSPGVSMHGTSPEVTIAQSQLAWAVRKSTDPMAKRKFTAIFQRGEGLPVHGKLDARTKAALDRY